MDMTPPAKNIAAVIVPDQAIVEAKFTGRSPGSVREQVINILLPIALAGAVLLAWEVAVRALKISPVILPAPSQVYQKSITILPLLVSNAIRTGAEALLSLIVAIVIGIAIGASLVYSKRFRAAVYPNLVFFQLIPKVALAPLFVIWLGIGIESRLVFTVFITFFPIAISTIIGLSTIDPIYIRFCRGLTASNLQIFTRVRVPFALPAIFGGIKIGVTMAFIGVIVSEFITSQSGLGYLILFAMARAETAVILGSIAFLCAIGLATYGLVVLLEIAIRHVWGAPHDSG